MSKYSRAGCMWVLHLTSKVYGADALTENSASLPGHSDKVLVTHWAGAGRRQLPVLPRPHGRDQVIYFEAGDSDMLPTAGGKTIPLLSTIVTQWRP